MDIECDYRTKVSIFASANGSNNTGWGRVYHWVLTTWNSGVTIQQWLHSQNALHIALSLSRIWWKEIQLCKEVKSPILSLSLHTCIHSGSSAESVNISSGHRHRSRALLKLTRYIIGTDMRTQSSTHSHCIHPCGSWGNLSRQCPLHLVIPLLPPASPWTPPSPYPAAFPVQLLFLLPLLLPVGWGSPTLLVTGLKHLYMHIYSLDVQTIVMWQ